MEDDSIVWQRFAQRGRVLMGVMRSLDVRLADIGAELDVSQGHLSSVLNTYRDLDVTKCKHYFEKVEMALARRGARIATNDDQIVVVYDREPWLVNLDRH